MMVYRYTKTTEYTRFNFRKTSYINFNLQKGASIFMVYGYTKTAEYPKSIKKTKKSILTHEKELPY